ncbi:MAG: 4'-phosphopantetheinyl transferase superfamily protein [Prevotellaceae bacterium]|nr:4'-phosphopantetheinyl transferase superfamily protein [Prevotellaceae bacterium]
MTTNPFFTFYDYWTIKESVIKAEGRGLSIPLKNIFVKFMGNERHKQEF